MDDVTLGELARRLDSMHTDVKEMRSSIVDHNDLTSVANSWTMLLAAHESKVDLQMQQVQAKVAALEAWNLWAMRIVLGLVLTSVVGLVLLPGKVFG